MTRGILIATMAIHLLGANAFAQTAGLEYCSIQPKSKGEQTVKGAFYGMLIGGIISTNKSDKQGLWITGSLAGIGGVVKYVRARQEHRRVNEKKAALGCFPAPAKVQADSSFKRISSPAEAKLPGSSLASVVPR
jgi:hypothetical protein